MIKPKTRKGRRTEYAIVGRKNGHDVWFCGMLAPRTWSRGDRWAICRTRLADMKRPYEDAIEHNDVKNIKIIKIVTRITSTEKIYEVKNHSFSL